MKLLLVGNDSTLKTQLSEQLGAGTSLSFQECSSADEGLAALKSANDLDGIVAPFAGANSELVQYIRDHKQNVPSILYYDPNTTAPELPVSDLSHNIRFVDSDHVGVTAKGFLSILSPSAASPAAPAANAGSSVEADFLPIRTSLLKDFSPLKVDVFIRLNATKFLKLFQAGDEINDDDVHRFYNKKRVEYLYMRQNALNNFIGEFSDELDNMLAREDVTQEEAMEAADMTQEAVSEFVNTLGFNNEVQEIVKKNVQMTLKAVGTNPKLMDIVRKVAKEGNYLSQHATALSFIACCIAKEMDWGSEGTFQKLILASFMHDVHVTNPELAKVVSLKELEEKKAQFAETEAAAYKNHPLQGSEMVKKFQEIPPDVDLIVLHHHERPDGSGFPRGLTHQYIAPLASVFIVAHDLVQALLAKKDSFSLSNFIVEKKEMYNKGNFRKVMQALEKVKI